MKEGKDRGRETGDREGFLPPRTCSSSSLPHWQQQNTALCDLTSNLPVSGQLHIASLGCVCSWSTSLLCIVPVCVVHHCPLLLLLSCICSLPPPSLPPSGISEGLLANCCGVLSESVRKQLFIVRTSGARLLALINDVMDAATLRQHRLVLKQERLELRQVVGDVVDLTRSLVRSGVQGGAGGGLDCSSTERLACGEGGTS